MAERLNPRKGVTNGERVSRLSEATWIRASFVISLVILGFFAGTGYQKQRDHDLLDMHAGAKERFVPRTEIRLMIESDVRRVVREELVNFSEGQDRKYVLKK